MYRPKSLNLNFIINLFHQIPLVINIATNISINFHSKYTRSTLRWINCVTQSIVFNHNWIFKEIFHLSSCQPSFEKTNIGLQINQTCNSIAAAVSKCLSLFQRNEYNIPRVRIVKPIYTQYCLQLKERRRTVTNLKFTFLLLKHVKNKIQILRHQKTIFYTMHTTPKQMFMNYTIISVRQYSQTEIKNKTFECYLGALLIINNNTS